MCRGPIEIGNPMYPPPLFGPIPPGKDSTSPMSSIRHARGRRSQSRVVVAESRGCRSATLRCALLSSLELGATAHQPDQHYITLLLCIVWLGFDCTR